MKRIALVVVTLVAGAAVAAGPRGTVPRSDATRYSARATVDGASVGASLISAAQAQREFASDVTRCCVVIEVALYPAKDRPLEVDARDFTLRIAGTETAVRPSAATTLAVKIQKTAPSEREISVHPTVGIGYESGPRTYDPITGGTRGGGVRTSAGVGVGVGGSRPASTDRDRETMELELTEKALPEGAASKAVAGYLYFQLPKRKNAAYVFEYAGQKLALR